MCQNNCQCALLFAFDTIRPTVNVASCLCVRLSCRVAFGRNGLQARVVLVRATACVCVRERVVIGKHNSSEEKKNKVRKPHPFGPGLTEGFHRGGRQRSVHLDRKVLERVFLWSFEKKKKKIGSAKNRFCFACVGEWKVLSIKKGLVREIFEVLVSLQKIQWVQCTNKNCAVEFGLNSIHRKWKFCISLLSEGLKKRSSANIAFIFIPTTQTHLCLLAVAQETARREVYNRQHKGRNRMNALTNTTRAVFVCCKLCSLCFLCG